MRWQRNDYMGNAPETARKLIGSILVHETPEGILKGRITECVQFIAATAGELFQKIRSPVSTIYFVRVIEKSMWKIGLVFFKGFVKVGKIAFYGSFVQVVHHIAFSTGSGTFHFLESLAYI